MRRATVALLVIAAAVLSPAAAAAQSTNTLAIAPDPVAYGATATFSVSTGATGNTPVGRWRVYLKTPGSNSLGMYYSLYFLRGFAIHGYASVPPYPAGHGCVRVPMWFAPRVLRALAGGRQGEGPALADT